MVEGGTPRRALLIGTLGALLLAASTAEAQSKVEKLQREFDSEQDPIDKAKRLAKLGDERIKELTEVVRAGDYDEANEVLGKYLESVEIAFEGLKNSDRNAEKKPSGFKQMQIHIRKSIRKIGDAAAAMPFELRESFNQPLKRLNTINAELIELLFPRKPGGV